MAVLVGGKLRIQAGARNAFVERSQTAVQMARRLDGCMDFSVSPDPIDPDRVNILELWQNRQAMEAFRQSGPDDDLFSFVQEFSVGEYDVHLPASRDTD